MTNEEKHCSSDQSISWKIKVQCKRVKCQTRRYYSIKATVFYTVALCRRKRCLPLDPICRFLSPTPCTPFAFPSRESAHPFWTGSFLPVHILTSCRATPRPLPSLECLCHQLLNTRERKCEVSMLRASDNTASTVTNASYWTPWSRIFQKTHTQTPHGL